MVLINLHRNLHEKSSFLSEIMFIRINPYLCHLLTRYQSTIFPNHKSCVRKKGVPHQAHLFFCVIRSGAESMPRHFPCFSGSQSVSVCFSLSQSQFVSLPQPQPQPFRVSVFLSYLLYFSCLPCSYLSYLPLLRYFPNLSYLPYLPYLPFLVVPKIYLIITALTIRTPERRFSSSLSASRW